MIKVQRRQTPAEVAALQCRSGRSADLCRRSVGAPPETKAAPRFYINFWIYFTVQNWVLDLGRSVTMLALPADWFPVNRPSAAEYLHALYAVATPLLLLKMLERSPRTLPRPSDHLGVIAIVMGTTLHLVAESVRRRLWLTGYQLHQSVRENPVMKNAKPPPMVEVAELLFYLDDGPAWLMWCAPVFLVLFFFFGGCFVPRNQEVQMPPAAWALLAPNAAYYWGDCVPAGVGPQYLIAEGQTFIPFIITFFTMSATVMHQRRRGFVPHANGLFVPSSFLAALLLVAVWVLWLWDDGVLRKKHPGLIYVPQPRTVFTLHLQQQTNASGGRLG